MAMYNEPNGNSNNTNNNNNKNSLLSQIDISQIIFGCKDQGAKQYQEDSFCTFESPDLSFIVAGVFDGHGGLNGQVASNIVSKLCMDYFEKNWQKAKLWNNNEWTSNMEIFYDHLHSTVRSEFVQVLTIYACILHHFPLFSHNKLVGNDTQKTQQIAYEQYQ